MGLDFPVPSFCDPRDPLPGDPHNCIAVADGEFEGWDIPAGSLLHVSQRGHLLSVVLARETDWVGVPFAAHHAVEFIGGEPRRGFLARDVELDEIPLKGGAPVSIARVEDELSVYSGTLSRDHWMEGRPCAKDTAFTRGPTLLLESFHPSEPIEVGGLPLAADAEVRFQDTRRGHRFWYGTLARATVISGVTCAAGHSIHFDPEGQLSQATLGEDLRAGTTRWAAGTEVHLSSGVVVVGTLAEPARLGRFTCAAGPVRLEDGEPTQFVLDAAQVIDGYPCRAGSHVRRRIDRRYELGAPFKSHGARFDEGDIVTLESYRGGEPWPTVVVSAPRTIRGIDLPTGSKVQLVGTFLRTLVLEPSSSILIAGRAIEAGSEVVLDLFGGVKDVFPPTKRPSSYREGAE